MIPYYDNLTSEEQNQFRQSLHQLLYEGSLQRILSKDTSAYDLLEQCQSEVNDFLNLFDTRLEVKEDIQCMYIESIEGTKGLVRIRKHDELIMLSVLRMELATAQQQGRLPYRIILSQLKSECEVRMKGLSMNRFKEILAEFRKLKLVHYSHRDLDQFDNTILILPLVFMLTRQNIEEMNAIIKRSQKQALIEEEE